MNLDTERVVDSLLLLRYANGTATEDERRLIERWAAGSEGRQKQLDEVATIWAASAQPLPEVADVDALWSRVRREIENDEKPARVTYRFGKRSPRKASHWLLRVAAVAAVVALAVLRPWDTDSPGDELAIDELPAYTTEEGEISRLEFTDGTEIVLGGASTLRIPDGFGQDTRDVYLDGEAYFEVARTDSHMFRVHTKRMTIENRGTRFTVIGFEEDHEESVAVADGSVAVMGDGDVEAYVLSPNDVVRVTSDGEMTYEPGASSERYFDWMEGTAHFDQAYIADAITVIKRRYGVTVRVDDSELAHRKFTGSLHSATLFDDLRGLANLLDAHFERDGRVVTLTAEG